MEESELAEQPSPQMPADVPGTVHEEEAVTRHGGARADARQSRSAWSKAAASPAAGSAQQDRLQRGNTEVMPIGKPGTPGAPSVTYVGTTAIVLSWSKPEDDGGAPIIGYRIWVCKLGTLNLEPVPFVWIGLRDPHKLRQPGEALEPCALLRWNIEIASELGAVVFAIQAVNTSGVSDPSEDSIPVEHAIAVTLLKRSLENSRSKEDLYRLLEYFQAKTMTSERAAKKVAKLQNPKAKREGSSTENSDSSDDSDISDSESDPRRSPPTEEEDEEDNAVGPPPAEAAVDQPASDNAVGPPPAEAAADQSASTTGADSSSEQSQAPASEKSGCPARPVPPSVSDRALRLAEKLEASGLLDGPLFGGGEDGKDKSADSAESLLNCLKALQGLDMELAPEAISFLQSAGLASKGIPRTQASKELKLWQKLAGHVHANGGVDNTLEKLEAVNLIQPLSGTVKLLIDMGFDNSDANRLHGELPPASAAVRSGAASPAVASPQHRQGAGSKQRKGVASPAATSPQHAAGSPHCNDKMDADCRQKLLGYWQQVIAIVQTAGGPTNFIATLGEAPLDAIAGLVPALRRAGLLCEDRGDTGGLGGTSCVALSEFLQECEAHGGVHQVLQCLRGADLAQILRECAKDSRCYCGRAPASALELWKLDTAASDLGWQRLGRRIQEHGGVESLMAALIVERERRAPASKATPITPMLLSSPSAAQPRLGKSTSADTVTHSGPKPLSPAHMSLSPTGLSQAPRFLKGRSSPTFRTSPSNSRPSPTELEEGIAALDSAWPRAGQATRRRKLTGQTSQPASPFSSGSTSISILLPWEMENYSRPPSRTAAEIRRKRPVSE